MDCGKENPPKLRRSASDQILEAIQRVAATENDVGPCLKSDLYSEAWKLTFSSAAFLIPALLAFSFQKYFLGIISVFTALAAMNYWRKAVFGWRRTIDMSMAKLATVIYLGHAFAYAKTLLFAGVSIFLTCCVFYTYTTVSQLIIQKSKTWLYYHATFHALVTLGQLVILFEMEYGF